MRFVLVAFLMSLKQVLDSFLSAIGLAIGDTYNLDSVTILQSCSALKAMAMTVDERLISYAAFDRYSVNKP